MIPILENLLAHHRTGRPPHLNARDAQLIHTGLIEDLNATGRPLPPPSGDGLIPDVERLAAARAFRGQAPSPIL